MNVIIETLNEKNKIKDLDIRDMSVNTVHNDFITNYLDFDTIIWNMDIRYKSEFTDLLSTKISIWDAKIVIESMFTVLYDVHILMLNSDILI